MMSLQKFDSRFFWDTVYYFITAVAEHYCYNT